MKLLKNKVSTPGVTTFFLVFKCVVTILNAVYVVCVVCAGCLLMLMLVVVSSPA